MPINEWSERIIIAELSDEPVFGEEINVLMKRLEGRPPAEMPDVIVDMKEVSYLNSSNIAQLLKLRQVLINGKSNLRICSTRDPVWSMLLITGLDKIFQFTDDTATALASLQIETDA